MPVHEAYGADFDLPNRAAYCETCANIGNAMWNWRMWLLTGEARYADPPGTILPFGGAQAYRGFGLRLLVEVFSGALSGGLCSREVPETPIGNCMFMLVLDPEHFGGGEHFRREVAGLVEFVRSCPRQQGVGEIVLPGDPERHSRRRSAAEGIRLDKGTWTRLVALAERLGVEVRAGR